ncbi:MAG: helix-turn-helix domain-containing protein [Chloroflexota bacterium]|nr:MAG: helix-turn-helix domain-containing protein [Chloroflexota bacterium]
MDKVSNCNGQSEWFNICVDCGRRVITHGSELPGQCPGCHGWRWLCHLQNPTEKIEPSSAERHQDTATEFCPPKSNAVAAKTLMDKNGASPTDNGGKRGRPRVMIPDDLIQQLSSDGMGAIRIAEKLKEKGIVISYKTIQRRLQGSLQ